jgi:glycolate oxidase iron-sulfur subunit
VHWGPTAVRLGPRPACLRSAPWELASRRRCTGFDRGRGASNTVRTSSAQIPAADSASAAARAIAANCNHFGFCTSTCPTYVLTHDENESPRGRIALITAMLDSGLEPAAQTVRHLDSCLSCLACVPICAMKVDYMHLIDHARAHVEQHYRRPLAARLMRSLVARTVGDRRLFRPALALGRQAKRLQRLVPPRMKHLLELIPAAGSCGAEDVRVGSYSAQGKKQYRVALLAGCAQRVLAPQINTATIGLLRRHGCEVVVARGAECCGSLELHMGRVERGRNCARRNIDAWVAEIDAEGLDAIVVNASGCGTTVKDYSHLFKHDSGYAERARRISALTVDVSEFLDRIGLLEPPAPRGYKVAYHDACSLRNGQRITRQPRSLLRAAGYTVVDVPEAHFCCGSAGTYNLLQPENARKLGQRKAQHVKSTGAELLAVGNIGCMTQLSLYTALPVVHTAELLDWATGGHRPVALQSLGPPPGLESSPSTIADGAEADVPGPDGVGVW